MRLAERHEPDVLPLKYVGFDTTSKSEALEDVLVLSGEAILVTDECVELKMFESWNDPWDT
jgi:hypothetical protein